MNKVYLQAELQNFSQKDIQEMVSPDTLARIKEKDSNPSIKVFSVGHEGEAQGKLVGYGKKAMQYFKDAVLQIADKMRLGLEVFQGHVSTNSHSGREKIGEVVGKTVQKIDDKIHSLAAIYIYPQFQNLKLNVASIENEVEYIDDGKIAKAININNVTGIALGDSAISKPAFPGATLLGALQAFAEENKNMTIEEIRAAIKESKYQINDVFSKEEIENNDAVKKLKQTEYEHAKRIERKLGEEREKVILLQKENDDFETKIKGLNEVVNISKRTNLLDSAIKDRKITDSQQKFINKNIDGFKSENDDKDKLSDDFNRFVDNQLKEFDEYASIMGVKKDDNNGDDNDNSGAGSGDGDSTSGGSELDSPKENDFIPGAKAA